MDELAANRSNSYIQVIVIKHSYRTADKDAIIQAIELLQEELV